jgi:large subunit ribosomal protein L28
MSLGTLPQPSSGGDIVRTLAAVVNHALTLEIPPPKLFRPIGAEPRRKMARRCEVTGKGTRSGRSIARRGLPKKKGGVGLKCTGVSLRTFKSNVQKVRVLLPNGTVRRMKLATSVIKKGFITLTIDGREQTIPLVKALRGRNRAFAKTKKDA